MPLLLSLEFSAPFHHGTGDGVAGIVDRALLRDRDGVPYLSGAAIKGKFRWAALRYLKAVGELRCEPQEGRPCRNPPFCIFCQVFGSPRVRGAAEFRDAYPAPGALELVREQVQTSPSVLLSGPTDVRASTAINRYRRTVESEHLFSTEVVLPALRFETEIGGPLDRAHVELLQKCARLLGHFGADSARGLGFCRYMLREKGTE